MKHVEPKSRSELIKETVSGFIITLAGLGAIFVPIFFLDKEPSKTLIGAGTVFVVLGMFLINKKITADAVATIGSYLPWNRDED